MAVENPIQVDQLNKRRVNYASSMLEPYWLVQYISFDTQFNDQVLLDSIEWKKGTDLGDGNVYINNVLLGRYFESQEEFIESCIHPKNNEGEEIFDNNRKPIQIVRDFNTETDASDFPIDPQKYSVIKVFLDNSIALAGKSDDEGNFSVDVYPSKKLKMEILESCIELVQNRIDKNQLEINEFQERISKYKEQLENLV